MDEILISKETAESVNKPVAEKQVSAKEELLKQMLGAREPTAVASPDIIATPAQPQEIHPSIEQIQEKAEPVKVQSATTAKEPEKEERVETTKTGLEFTLGKLIGEGGFAKVYEAETSIGRKIAVKIPNNKESAEQLFNEAKLQASLAHPNIITIEQISSNGSPVAIMPLTKGSLDTTIQRSVEESLDIIKQIASALDYAHKNGIIHRDIKPQNILEKDGKNYVLADFGTADTTERIAQSISLTGQATPSLLGTIKYMAPEIQEGRQATAQSDIYSLSVVLCELLTGQKPDHTLEKVLEEKKIPENVRNILKKGIEKDLKARYKSCEELLHDIENAGANEQTSNSSLFDELAKRISVELAKRISVLDNDGRIKCLENRAFALYAHFGKCAGKNARYTLRFLYKNKQVRFEFNVHDHSLFYFGINKDWTNFVEPFAFYSLQKYKDSTPKLLFCTEKYFDKEPTCEDYLTARLRSSSSETISTLNWCYDVMDIAEAAITMIFLNRLRYAQRQKCKPFAQWKVNRQQELCANAEFNGSVVQLKEYASRIGIGVCNVPFEAHCQFSAIGNPFVFDALIMNDTCADKAVVLQDDYSLPLILKSNSLITANNGVKVFVPYYSDSQAHFDYLVKEHRSYQGWFRRGNVIISHETSPALGVECIMNEGDKLPVPFKTGPLEALVVRKIEGRKIYSPSLASAEQQMTGTILVYAFDNKTAQQVLADAGRQDCPIKRLF